MPFSFRKNVIRRRDSKTDEDTEQLHLGETLRARLRKKVDLHPRNLSSNPAPQTYLSNIPTPSAQLVQADRDVSWRLSPSEAVLDKDKSYSPSRLATSIYAAPPSITITTPDSRDIRRIRVRGTDFDIVSPPGSGSGMAKAKSNENLPLKDDERDFSVKPRRSTRPETRRLERSGSHPANESPQGHPERSSSLVVQPALGVSKSSATRTPSPCEPSKESSPLPQPKRSGIDDALRQLDGLYPPALFQHESSPPKPHQEERGSIDESLPNPPKSSPASRFATALPISSDNVIPPSPPYHPYHNDSPTSLDYFEAPIVDGGRTTVFVRPPIHDLSKNAAQQWESDKSSDSRPPRAWAPSKRWTCCRCNANTIAEQVVCSNLMCAHDRCPKGCHVTLHAGRLSVQDFVVGKGI